ncbi:alpha/beta hydrolase-fold protein [Cytophagaceae bacterium DM2B3-1]|uniref:Alpha/beta hydrolase-fold protein n=1 Tax=Xanthocytophaga flava TaxID=3048013 RepID=A0ABT7CTI7_9BACT|nr:alpha/beta hydrolase-fold protein [Xanthocytophaga flavus]MDJ1467932.1 alpha/beta hydrolase-fold protein [Xanthocytophaga flavus]MDJ1497059.1 alpha/beta hydrolase-fold protein [Xanthocytophaga flavus]
MKILVTILLLILATFSRCTQPSQSVESEEKTQFVYYSEFVRDSFHIQVQLPLEYLSHPDKRYPTVYLLDGNFYFPMMASTLHQYELGGLLDPMILVGIGYSSFKMMDSLRIRDYLYPKPLTSDEIKSEGGGQRFQEFLTKELLTKIDASFRTQKNNRSLLGHSFGGYFTLYSLLDQLENKSNSFQTFIAASPTLWYNNFYLNKLPAALKNRSPNDSLQIFVSAGALEDSVWNVKPVQELASVLQKKKIDKMVCQSHIYNHLDHMDVGILSFTKGLQAFTTRTKTP